MALASDGTLSGTPTKPGVYTVKVNDTDSYDCSSSNTYQVTVSTYEADVAPRSDGNGAVTIAGWTRVGRFVVGLDPVNANEFQRAVVSSEPNALLIQLDALGGEQAFAFSLSFDPTAVTLADATLETEALFEVIRGIGSTYRITFA